MPGVIADAKSKMPPPGNFLSEQEREDLYKTATPLFLKGIRDDRVSKFPGPDGQPKKQWTLTMVRASGGDEFDLSLSKNVFRDPLFEQLRALLETDEHKLAGIGPVKLDKYKAGNGNMAWTIEDYEPPAKAAPVSGAVPAAGTASAKCVSCGQTQVGAIIQMGEDKFIAHDCTKDKKKVLLPVAK